MSYIVKGLSCIFKRIPGRFCPFDIFGDLQQKKKSAPKAKNVRPFKWERKKERKKERK